MSTKKQKPARRAAGATKRKSMEICPDKEAAMDLNRKIAKDRAIESEIQKEQQLKTVSCNKSQQKHAIIDGEVQSEPVFCDKKPMWLFIKKEKTIPVVPDRSVEEILKNPSDPEIKITFTTKEAGLWQCKKCSATIHSDKQPDYCNACNRASNFERITKKVNLNRWKIPHWEEIPTDELDMEKTYETTITLVKRCVVFPEEIHYKLFSLWIIASYKNNSFDSSTISNIQRIN